MSLSGTLPRPRPGEQIPAAHIRALSDAIRDRTPISSPEIRVVPRTGGFSLEFVGKPGAAWRGANLPLTVNYDGTVTYGTILGVEPLIDSERISLGPKLTFPSEGQQYVCATVTSTPTQTTIDGKVFTHALTDISIAISVEETDPGADGLVSDEGSYKFVLANLLNGVLYQNGFGPIGGGVDDLMTGDGMAALNLIYPGTA